MTTSTLSNHLADTITSLSLNLDSESIVSSQDTTINFQKSIQQTSFLDLPREIRDQIYTLIFRRSSKIYPSKSRSGVLPYISLLRTSRQVYLEIIPILYGGNVFQVRGDPRWASPEFLNLVSCQNRDGIRTMRDFNRSQVCRARYHLKSLYIPSHGINLDRLKHLFSLLKYFPNLEYLEVVFHNPIDVNNMEVVNMCRLLIDRHPIFARSKSGGFVLRKRISYTSAEDISWMVLERPYKDWRKIIDDVNRLHVWQNTDDIEKTAQVVNIVQNIPE
jgi:hypothetical protein